MPKLERKRRVLHEAPATTSGPAVDDEPADVPRTEEILTRGQRKRREKKESWLRKFDFAQYAQLQREQREADLGKIVSLDELGDELTAIEEAQKKRQEAAQSHDKTTRKKKQRMAEREMQRFDAVLNFGRFQQDPFGTLQLHLKNTIKPIEKKPEKKTSSAK
eukprot:GDKH01007446.1.p1 GENE.GDKH01007446.1~~GDKH01007446.1.p1  ORF type:complete len:181 (-),score=20.91 GDKH01007446.1:84-569(-)